MRFQENKLRAGILSAALLAVMLFMAFNVIPKDLEGMLAKERSDALPEFDIHELDGMVVKVPPTFV